MKPRWARWCRGGVGLGGASAALAAFGLDLGGPGLGPAQVLVGAVGLALLVMALLDRQDRLSPGLVLALASSYLACLVAETALQSLSPTDTAAQLRGLYCPDPVTGYALAPGWQGRFDDGVARGQYRINSRGQRDDEPRALDESRVLLLGDSFAFGALLDEGATIDRQVERLAPGRAVYNLGVGGYGLPAIVETFKRCGLPAQQAVYLFFNNDLRDDNLLLDLGQTVVDGYLVPTTDPSGHPYSPAALQQRVRETIAAQARAIRPGAVLTLTTIRQRLYTVVAKLRTPDEFAEQMRLSGGTGEFHDDNVALAVTHTLALQSLASARGMTFSVVIVPSLGEVRSGRHAQLTDRYLAELQRQQVPVLPLLPRLSPRGYFLHDGHFNPTGAAIAAQAILEALSTAPHTAPRPAATGTGDTGEPPGHLP